MESPRIDASTSQARDRAIDDFIELLHIFDRILQAQAAADAGYFMRLCERSFDAEQQRAIRDGLLRAYRWQYIVSGQQHPHFEKLLSDMVDQGQLRRIHEALEPFL